MDIREGSNVDGVGSDIYNWIEIEDDSYDVLFQVRLLNIWNFFWKALLKLKEF